MAEQYEKKELRQHIYDTPDTYVGGIDKINEVLPILNDNKIVFKEIEYIPALLNIFNEILVNARDQIVRLQGSKDNNTIQVSHIKIDFNDDVEFTTGSSNTSIALNKFIRESSSTAQGYPSDPILRNWTGSTETRYRIRVKKRVTF